MHMRQVRERKIARRLKFQKCGQSKYILSLAMIHRDGGTEFLKQGFGIAYRPRTEGRDETCQKNLGTKLLTPNHEVGEYR